MNHVQLKTIPLKNNPIYNERWLQDAMADKDAARLEHDEAIKQAMVDMLSNNTELYKLFSDNPSFRQWLTSSSFAATYQQAAYSH